MFGTVVEQLESAIEAAAALVASVEDVDVSRAEALEALLALERLRERLEATVGGLATDLEARDAHRPGDVHGELDGGPHRSGPRRRRLPAAPGPRSALDARHRWGAGRRRDHPHGRLKGNFDIGGDLAITVKTAVDEIVSELLRADEANHDVDPTDPGLDELPSQRRARALGELCTRAAASPQNPARRQPLFVMHTTVDTLAETGDPTDWMLAIEQAWSSVIPLDAAHLWSCDCWLADVVIRRSDGEVLDAGRELRVANRAMRRALVARDGHCCAVPGCDRPVGWCDAHHILRWTDGGLTKVENLGMREPDHADIASRECSQKPRQLPGSWSVYPLQQAPVTRRWQPEIVVG